MYRWLIVSLVYVVAASASAAEPRTKSDRPVDPKVIQTLVARVEPKPEGDFDRIPQYLDFFRTSAANDVRHFGFGVMASPAGDGMRVSGYTEFPETRNAIVAYFKALGFDKVESTIEILPSPELGEKTYGIIKSRNSLSYAEPAEKEVVTDCLLGETVFILKEEDNHYLVHAGDGYLGWVASKDVAPMDAEAFVDYLDGPRVFVLKDYDAGDPQLPAGAKLKLVKKDDGHVIAETPSGGEVKLPAEICDIRETPAERIDVVCNNAKQLLGTEYLWGGKSSKGCDCSGLVQTSFAAGGVTIPRDASQQFIAGQLTATRTNRAGMRRGDTLYFINPQGRISHTGLYLGDDQFIHAVSPVVRINSFNPKDDNYAEAQDVSFAFAKRIW